jgi:thiazole biosynthesis enzyme
LPIDETMITRRIVERAYRDFLDHIDVDVVIVGCGPSALVAAKCLADAGMSTVIFERKLAPGGGMWGGGMNFPVIVVQEESRDIMEDIAIPLEDTGDGYFTANSVQSTARMIAAACDAGAMIYNAVTVEDVLIRDGEVAGVVINWAAVDRLGMHVDPIMIRSKYVIDATGHDAEICSIVQRKAGALNTPTGKVEGERSMAAEVGERMTVENTIEVFPRLYVTGMACNAVMGAPRMGPIFGGMLMSGRKVAEMIIDRER